MDRHQEVMVVEVSCGADTILKVRIKSALFIKLSILMISSILDESPNVQLLQSYCVR